MSALTDRATAKDFEPVTIDLKVGSSSKFFEQRLNAAIFELDNSATVGTDQVMVVPVGNATQQIRVAPVRPVESIQNTVLDEQVERPEDRCPANTRIRLSQSLEQIVGGEGTFRLLNLMHDGTPRTCQAVSRVLKDLERPFDSDCSHVYDLHSGNLLTECSTLPVVARDV